MDITCKILLALSVLNILWIYSIFLFVEDTDGKIDRLKEVKKNRKFLMGKSILEHH